MSKANSNDLQAAFLENASKYLAISGPSTSAHLGSERIALMLDDEATSTKALRDQWCTACGSVSIVGWTTTFKLGKQDRKKPKVKCQRPSKQGSKKHDQVISICGTCHRETVATLPAKRKIAHSAPSKSQTPVKTDLSIETSATVPKPADRTSSTSKQRAKARKERIGLQALLKKSKQNTTSSTMNLMDLMKA